MQWVAKQNSIKAAAWASSIITVSIQSTPTSIVENHMVIISNSNIKYWSPKVLATTSSSWQSQSNQQPNRKDSPP